MTKWLLYLLLSPIMTPQERADTLAHYKARAHKFKCEHWIDDTPPELEELERKLDEEDRNE